MPEYGIGSTVWPGTAKVLEESAEVGQVLGKLIAAEGRTDHWDGTNLRQRISEEVADLRAALDFFEEANGLAPDRDRARRKLDQFRRWHIETLAAASGGKDLTATDSRPTLYIAGPMTGLPEYNRPAFLNAEEALLRGGHRALNPARQGPDPAKTWGDYMILGFVDIRAADGVALLPGWEESRGARLEVAFARDLGLPVHGIDHWEAETILAAAASGGEEGQ